MSPVSDVARGTTAKSWEGLPAVLNDVAIVLRKNADRTDREGQLVDENVEAFRQSGLLGLLVPRKFGGIGASYADFLQATQTLAAECLSTAMVWAMHNQQVAVLTAFADERVKRDVLPRIAAGEVLVASVTSERGKGGHVLTARAPLRTVDGQLELVREAPVVTAGTKADAYLITMRASEDSPPNEVSIVYATREQLEVSPISSWDPMGMRGTDSAGLALRGEVGPAQVINGPGGFEEVAISTLMPLAHLSWAAAWLGAAQRIFGDVVTILRDPAARKEYDIHSDLLAARLGRARAHLDTTSAVIRAALAEYETIRRYATPDRREFYATPFQIHINTVKVVASELAQRTVDELIQLVGLRYGYLRNTRTAAERVFRDLRSASLMYSNERLLIANGKLALVDRRVTLS